MARQPSRVCMACHWPAVDSSSAFVSRGSGTRSWVRSPARSATHEARGAALATAVPESTTAHTAMARNADPRDRMARMLRLAEYYANGLLLASGGATITWREGFYLPEEGRSDRRFTAGEPFQGVTPTAPFFLSSR